MVLFVVAVLIIFKLVAELFLAWLNRREVLRHTSAPPPSVAATMDAATYARAVQYTLAKNQFGMLSLVFEAGLLLLVLSSGVLPWLFAQVAVWAPGASWDDAVFLVLVGVLLSVPGLPLEWWEQFHLEGRFGFNKSTPGLWVTDKVKGLVLGTTLGFLVVWGLLALVGLLGPWWWVWGTVALLGLQLTMMVLYPKVILPWFNRLTPLPEGELRTRLMALAERTGFRAATIEVIDGSKRSGHSNAFFTGFGRWRRIVLFDTLIAQLTPEELEAVLAHEVGHYRCGHIPRMIALSAFMQLAMLATVGLLAGSAWFNPGFMFPAGEIAPALLLVGLLSGVALFWLTPLGNLLSRKHEYEADAFARAAVGGAAPLVAALRKLAQKNLSNLTPHPWYSGFYYSHPTLVEREAALAAGTVASPVAVSPAVAAGGV